MWEALIQTEAQIVFRLGGQGNGLYAKGRGQLHQ